MRRLLVLFAVLCALASLAISGCTAAKARKAGIGDPCVPGQGQCADGLCVAADNQSGFCSKNCASDGVCPDGFRCQDAGKNGLICVRPNSCKLDGDCPSGHRCDQVTGECYIKVSRQLCSPCTNDLQCPVGGACFIVPASGERYCTSACNPDGSCPEGYACSTVPILKIGAPTESRRQCVPNNPQGTCEGGKSLCAPCRGDSECGGAFDVCVRNVVSGETFCGKNCDPARKEDCPESFGCVDLSGGGKGPFQCVPNSNSCKGYCDTADEAKQILQCGLGRDCDVKNKSCRAAVDGRECAPCRDNDDCRKAGHESNECVINNCADCPQKGETFCAEPCPPDATGDKDCKDRFGPGFACAGVGQNHFCVPQRGTCVSGLGRLGDTCTSGGAKDCVTGICLAYGKNALCSATCSTDASCGDLRKFRCCELSGGFYDCAASRRNASGSGPLTGTGVCAPNGGLFGDDCSPGRPPCQSGTCLDIGTARLCTVPCGDGGACPTDFVCRDAFVGGKTDATKICFPDGGGEPGSDCRFGPASCADRLCLKKESGAVCSKGCAGAATCPTDWVCKTVDTTTQGKVEACVPPDLQ